MTLIRRKIDLGFQLGKDDGNFAGASNAVELSGLRVSATIQKAGDPSLDTADIRVWGLPPSVMNKLSTLGKPLQFFRDNTVTVKAGDANSGMAIVFNGVIQSAYQDFTGAPDASLNIRAFVGLIEANKPISPTSAQGPADVATIMQGIALAAGLKFENNNVNVKLPTIYLPGTSRQQMQALAQQADIFWTIDDNVVAIWPKNGKRARSQTPLFSPETGMVGYPRWTDGGIGIRSLYVPTVIIGGEIAVKSSLPVNNGKWIVNNLRYTLESETIDGAWFLDLEAYLQGNAGG